MTASSVIAEIQDKRENSMENNTEKNRENNNHSVFRQKTIDRISSPEQLTDYLKVTGPGIWAVLAAVILLLIGLIVWSAVGTLETTADARVIVRDSKAIVVLDGAHTIRSGMTLRVASEEYMIGDTESDEYGRTVGTAEVDLPNGKYDGKVVVEKTHPISFLLESRNPSGE